MDEVSDRDIRLSYWLLTHRDQLRRGITVALTVLATALMGYSLWQIVDLVSSRKAEEEAMNQLVASSFNTDLYRQTLSPMSIQVGTVTAIPTSQGTYDVIAEIKNPNFKWAARELPFVFKVDGREVSGKTFLLPLEEKYAVSLAVPLQARPQSVEFVPGDIRWLRIRDLSELQTPSFDVSDQKIEALVTAEGASSGTQVSFNLKNTSPYSFWQTTVTVVLSAAGSVQAVGRQALTNVDSQGTYRVEFRWPNSSMRVDNLVVKPEVNILDPRVFR
jgi:hypothetical protein